MPRSVQRLGDVNDAEAPIIAVNQNSLYINNILVSVEGSLVQDHILTVHIDDPDTEEDESQIPIPSDETYQHRFVVTGIGLDGLYLENQKLNVAGDIDSCGHIRMNGSDDTFIGE